MQLIHTFPAILKFRSVNESNRVYSVGLFKSSPSHATAEKKIKILNISSQSLPNNKVLIESTYHYTAELCLKTILVVRLE